MRRITIILLLITCMALPACNRKSITDKNTSDVKTEVTFTKDTYPKIDGSTATIPLSEAYAENLLGMTEKEAAKYVKHNTTHNAYVNLIKGKDDIIFVTKPSDEELKIAKDANVELEVVPVVKEGFVFMVNTENIVENLTSKQIRDIYQGKIKNWREVGGKDKEIIAFQREKNSGSQTLMEQLVMKGLKLADEPKTVVFEMAGLIEAVASYENSDKALGYSVFYYAKTMYMKDNIKLLSIDGVHPDNKTISSGKYPFTTAFYAVIKKSEAKNSSARKLLSWALSKDGQVIAEKAGYVPLEMGKS